MESSTVKSGATKVINGITLHPGTPPNASTHGRSSKWAPVFESMEPGMCFIQQCNSDKDAANARNAIRSAYNRWAAKADIPPTHKLISRRIDGDDGSISVGFYMIEDIPA